MKEGCDIVGGLPWYEYTDAEAREHIDICFDLAKKYDRDIHMLVDDTDDENSRSLEYLALKTMREGFHGRVAASHCGAMAAYNDVYAAKIVDMVATAGVTISVNAHINLVCSARLDREPRRRGIARVKELLARGANVVTSQDDVNDPYYPFGKPDPLECVSMIAHVAQLTLPHELEQAMSMVTENAAKAARVSDYGIAPGNRADLVVVGAPSVHEAIRLQPPRRHVLQRTAAKLHAPFSRKSSGRELTIMQTKRAERLELAAAAREPFLRIAGVDKVFSARGRGALKAVDNVSLDIRHGEFVSIVGPSGCGKSTLMMMVSGLVPTTNGEIIIDTKKVTQPYDNLSIVFQRDALLEWRTVLDNVLLQIDIRASRAQRSSRRTRRRSAGARRPLPASKNIIRGSCRAVCASASRSAVRFSTIRRCC